MSEKMVMLHNFERSIDFLEPYAVRSQANITKEYISHLRIGLVEIGTMMSTCWIVCTKIGLDADLLKTSWIVKGKQHKTTTAKWNHPSFSVHAVPIQVLPERQGTEYFEMRSMCFAACNVQVCLCNIILLYLCTRGSMTSPAL